MDEILNISYLYVDKDVARASRNGLNCERSCLTNLKYFITISFSLLYAFDG